MALGQTIADRAAGNPFFAEEIVRELAERGVLRGELGAYLSTANVAEVGPNHQACQQALGRRANVLVKTKACQHIAGVDIMWADPSAARDYAEELVKTVLKRVTVKANSLGVTATTPTSVVLDLHLLDGAHK